MGKFVELREETGRTQLQPDAILPAQFLSRTIATPETRLLLAVLEEAVGTYRRYVMATDRRGRALFTEVEAWFASEDTVRLFSFGAICDVTGLNATYVRSGLALWVDTHRATSLETAQPVDRFPFHRLKRHHAALGQWPGAGMPSRA